MCVLLHCFCELKRIVVYDSFALCAKKKITRPSMGCELDREEKLLNCCLN